VSPQNVVVSYDGHVKLMDFGIAKFTSSSNDTATGHFKGKVAYAAPEQVFGARVDRRVDIFAMGIVLYELASGARFWGGATDVEIMSRLATHGIPRPSGAHPELPPALARAIEKATMADRDQRHATALEFATELEALLSTGQTARARELGHFLQTRFEAERREIRATIESQSRSIPALDESPPRAGAASSLQSLPRLAAGDGERSEPSMLKVATDAPAPVMPGSSRARRYAIGALAVAVAGVALGTTAYRMRRAPVAPAVEVVEPSEPKPPATASPGASPPAAVASPNDTGRTIVVTLSAWPATAQLFLDGKPLPSNPARVSARSDDALHEVRATAPAYSSASRVLRFEPGQKIDLVLTSGARGGAPAHAAPPARHGERPPPRIDPPTDLLAPAPHPAPTGTIDEKDPYK
jgi:hypothetical protein